MRVVDNREAWNSAYKAALIKGLEMVGQEEEGDAKEITPVDTGALRNSITHYVNAASKTTTIGTNIEYGKYVELNDKASHKTGQAHFLRDSCTWGKEKWRKIIESCLKNA
jgi:phage gpG-like protein